MTWFYLALIRNGKKKNVANAEDLDKLPVPNHGFGNIYQLYVSIWMGNQSQNLSNLKGLFATRVFNVEVPTEFLTIFSTVAEVSLIHPRWLQPLGKS